MNLSETALISLIVAAEVVIAVLCFIGLLHYFLRKDYRSLKDKFDKQNKKMDRLGSELKVKLDENTNAQRGRGGARDPDKQLAGMNLENAQLKRKMGMLENELDFSQRRIRNLETYQSLYKTLRTAAGTNARFQSNLNAQIRKTASNPLEIEELVSQSEHSTRSFLDLVGEPSSHSPYTKKEGDKVGDEAIAPEDEPQNELVQKQDQDATETLQQSTDSLAQFGESLAEQKNIVHELKQRVEETGDQDIAEELGQLEAMLDGACEENKSLRDTIRKMEDDVRRTDLLKSDLQMSRSRVQILEAEKRRLDEERNSLKHRVEHLNLEVENQYKKMITLAKQLAKGGATPNKQEPYNLKKELQQKEEAFQALQMEHEQTRKEFIELESMYLKMVEIQQSGQG